MTTAEKIRNLLGFFLVIYQDYKKTETNLTTFESME